MLEILKEHIKELTEQQLIELCEWLLKEHKRELTIATMSVAERRIWLGRS